MDVPHTDDMPNKERTEGWEILKVAEEQDWIVVTKDSDFLDSHIITGIPRRLLFLTTGNITNKILIGLFESNIDTIISLFRKINIIELSRDEIIANQT